MLDKPIKHHDRVIDFLDQGNLFLILGPLAIRNRLARAIAEAGRRRSRHLYWLYQSLIHQRLRIGGPTVFWRVDRRAHLYTRGLFAPTYRYLYEDHFKP